MRVNAVVAALTIDEIVTGIAEDAVMATTGGDGIVPKPTKDAVFVGGARDVTRGSRRVEDELSGRQRTDVDSGERQCLVRTIPLAGEIGIAGAIGKQ